MIWLVEFHDDFKSEFDSLSADVQDAIVIEARLLEMMGPELGRPDVDTLKGSRFANMKEMRFKADSGATRG